MMTVSPLPAAVIALSTSRRDGLEAVIVIAINVPDEITIKHKSTVSFFTLLEFKGSEPPGIGIYADESEWRSIRTLPETFFRRWMVISNQKPSTPRGFLIKRLFQLFHSRAGQPVRNQRREKSGRLTTTSRLSNARDVDLRKLATA